MGYPVPIGAFVTVVSAGAWIELLIAIGAMALNYWAISRIIAQAGYSRTWILLPLAPLVLTFISFFVLWHDLDAIAFGGSIGFFGIDSIGFVWHLDQLSIVTNWAFFLVFAFSRWPVSEGRHTDRTYSPRPPDSSGTTNVPASNLAAPPNPIPVPRGMPPSAAGPGAGPAAGAAVASVPTAAKKPGAQFCAWCGEALPGNRALFHDCGPKDRPVTFCKSCGTGLTAGATQCSACGAA